MKEEEILKYCHEKGYLNAKGLLRLIDYIDGTIKDHSQDIKNICKYKGLTESDEEVKNGTSNKK